MNTLVSLVICANKFINKSADNKFIVTQIINNNPNLLANKINYYVDNINNPNQEISILILHTARKSKNSRQANSSRSTNSLKSTKRRNSISKMLISFKVIPPTLA